MQNRDVRIVPLLFGRIHMDKCPQCDYVLEALPAAHVCPECGLAYHGETTIVKVCPISDSLMFLTIAFGGMTIPAFGIAARDWSWGVYFFGFWMFVNCVLAVRIIFKMYLGERGELVINRNGVSLTRPGAGTEYVKTADINHAKHRWWSIHMVVLGWDGRKMLSLNNWELNGSWNATNCAKQINRHVEACLVRTIQGGSFVD